MKEQVPPIVTKCPECGKGHLVALTRPEEFDFDLGEEKVKVRAENVPVRRCDVCGEIMSGPAAAKVRHEAVCRAAGFLTPTEYKLIREEQGWSQQHLADLAGFGVATVSRSERGRIMPNRSYDKVLRAIRDCPAFRVYLQRAKPASADGFALIELLVVIAIAYLQRAKPASADGAVLPFTGRYLVPDQKLIERGESWRLRTAC